MRNSPARMHLRERALYHQIHPLKLAVDIGALPVALTLLWRRKTLPALAVAFLPSVAASAAVMHVADLEPYRDSPAGRYLARAMTPAMQAVRLLGAAIMMVGAWSRTPRLFPIGLLVILFGWFRGLAARPPSTASAGTMPAAATAGSNPSP
jgi:hypothetical protein